MRFSACIVMGVATFASAQQPVSAASNPAPMHREVAAFEAALVGRWSGVLEYRDYSTDARTKLPTWASIALPPDGLNWQYVYDDGPNKQVTENLAVMITASTYTVVDTDKPQDKISPVVIGLDKLKNGCGTLFLTGTALENDHAVDTRTTLTLRRNLLEITKETRAAGEEFRFRDGYVLTRSTPLDEAATLAVH